MRPSSNGSAGRIVFLDYLRIFAFASVLAGHKFHAPVEAAAHAESGGWRWPARAVWPLIEGGGAGVVVFFLVSGYIITQVLQREGTAEFLIKRMARVYPLYVVAVLTECVLMRTRGQMPAAGDLLAQLLLVGDAFATPYALAGVEWTLRLEMLFYALMACLRAACMTHARRGRWLIALYVLVCAALYAWGPWATHTDWTRGYITLYLPFLLLGSAIWLRERGAIGWPLLGLVVVTVFCLYRWGLAAWQPRWLHAPFAALAVALFLGLWALRRQLFAPAWVLALSELTYAVYLFHNWLFDALRDGVMRWGVSRVQADLAALMLLGFICWALVRTVERPGMRAGRWVARRWTTPCPAGPAAPHPDQRINAADRAGEQTPARTSGPASSRN